MSCSFDAAILFSGDQKKAKETLLSLQEGAVRPGKILILCTENEADSLAEAKGDAEIVPLPARDRGLFMAQAIRRTDAPFLLILTDASGKLSDDFAAGLLRHFEEEPACEIAFSAAFKKNKASSLPKAFYDALYTVCPAFGKEQIYTFGPQLFMRDLGAAMFRRDLLTVCPPEVGALTKPERILTARAVYRDGKVALDQELRTEECFRLNPSSEFHDAFSFSAARRLYYQTFGIGFRMHKKMKGKGFTENPVLKTSMGKAYGRAGRKAAGTLLKHGAFYKIPYLFLIVLSAKLGESLGGWYHRFPAALNRHLAGNRYF